MARSRPIARLARAACALGFLISYAGLAQTTRVQFIQASLYPEADTIDVYVNGVLTLADFAYTRGTPFTDFPAGEMRIETRPGGRQEAQHPFHTQTVMLVPGERYHIVAAGDPLKRAGEPPFTWFVHPGALEGSRIPGFLEALTFNNNPLSAVYAMARGVTDQSAQAQPVPYGAFGEVNQGVPMVWDQDCYMADRDSTYAVVLDLTGCVGKSTVALGFCAAAVWSDGTTLVPVPNVAAVQFIHDAKWAGADTVDVFVDGRRIVAGLAYGEAAASVELPSGVREGTAPELVVEVRGTGDKGDPLVVLNRKFVFGRRYVAVLAGDSDSSEDEDAIMLVVSELEGRGTIESGRLRAGFFHGAPGVAAVEVVLEGRFGLPVAGPLVYGAFASSTVLPAADTTLMVVDAADGKLLASYRVDLASLGSVDSTVVLLTAGPGMLSGEEGVGDSGLRLLAAPPSGGRLIAFEATVPPPWWRQPWVLLVGLAVIGLIGLAWSQLRVRRLEARSRELSTLVEERTRELRLEKEKTEAQAHRLLELDEAKNRFFANISHEFRTPLTLILGPLQDAVDGRYDIPDEGFGRLLPVMRRNARRLLRLVNQLLDLSRLESGKMSLHPEPGDLVSFARDLTRSFVPLAERRRIALTFRSKAETALLAFDPDALEKTLSNLISNALKFTPEGGEVYVGLEAKPGDVVEVAVRDTGPGIGPEDLKRVFDRFQQVDTSIRRAHEGSGIGLTLARELTELHGGTLEVESTVGSGSTFRMRLPLPEMPPVVKERPAQPSAGTPEAPLLEEAALPTSGNRLPASAGVDGDRPLVLIVEDNPDVRAYVRGHLETDYRVIEACDGEEGLETAVREEPDLILADVMMPRMDGYELCRLVKANEDLRQVPVVMLTAKASERDTVEGLKSGADDYLAKPFSVSELAARVANLIGSRRELREKFSREVFVRPADIAITPEDEVFLDRVLEVVNAHLDDTAFTVDWMANEVGVSRRQLERRIEEVAGETPGSLMRKLRLERASQLLRARAGTVAEVAYAVGFKSPAHFSRAFKEDYGQAPSEYGRSSTEVHDA